jgi:pseudouridine synthase
MVESGNLKRKSSGTVPLERALSKLGLASRSQARAWIREGRLTVDGTIRNDPLFPIVPETARFKLDGHSLTPQEKVYLMLHKPTGVVTTRSDEKGRPTIFSLLPRIDGHIHAVGRLDLASTGLLLVTNDTRFSSYLTDPKNRIVRAYVVTVRGEVTPDDMDLLRKQTEEVTLRKSSRKESHLIVKLTEGKNREIRKMFEDVGHEVTRLKRTAFGGFRLGDLKPGEFRTLTGEEVGASHPGAR